MSDIYTIVDGPGAGYACNGRKSRDEAIAEAREYYSLRLVEIMEFLRQPISSMNVRVVRGINTQRLVEELKP